MKVRLRVKPGSHRNHVGGSYPGPHGPELVVAVTARAMDGQANVAVVVQLAQNLGCPKSEIRIVSGHTGRSKSVEIPDFCAHRIQELLQ